MENKNVHQSDYRYERKFFIKGLTFYEVESHVKLHPAIFSKIFHQRFVNNIYFDSHKLNNFHKNVDGASNRLKVRIRWYGDLFGHISNPVLEIKIRKGLLGKKISTPIDAFQFSTNTQLIDILKSIRHLSETIGIDFESLSPSLVNRYSRHYFQSCDGNFRITLDKDQSFYPIHKSNNSFISDFKDRDSVILELKYDQEYDQQAGNITTKFPFRLTKSSKYVSGIHKLFQQDF